MVPVIDHVDAIAARDRASGQGYGGPMSGFAPPGGSVAGGGGIHVPGFGVNSGGGISSVASGGSSVIGAFFFFFFFCTKEKIAQEIAMAPFSYLT